MNDAELTLFHDHDSEKFAKMTDKDLFIELRLRGRLVFTESHTVCPHDIVQQGYPSEEQIKRTFDQVAYEMSRKFIAGQKIAGVNWTYPLPEFGYSHSRNRKLSIKLLYMTDK